MTIKETVDYLCSDACAGRKTGSAEGIAARRYIIEQFERIGLSEATPGFEQVIPEINGANVVGTLPGASERTILVAAHYDHLGRTGDDAFWGADDNASAVAIMLEVAAQLAKKDRLERRILFCAFDAEEPPHFLGDTMGSQRFVKEPLIPLESIDMMVCMDLMGHALGSPNLPRDITQSVFALGAEKSEGTGALVDAVNEAVEGAVVRRLGGDVVPPLSDYYAFSEAEVPYLFLTCGRWAHYHTITDTPDRLDYPKMDAMAELLGGIVERLAARPGVSRYDAEARDDGASLATIRDMGTLLAKDVPAVAKVTPVLEMLEEAVDRDGVLGLSDRQSLSALVGGLEAALQ